MTSTAYDVHAWIRNRVKPEEVSKYKTGSETFIPEHEIEALIDRAGTPDPGYIRDIFAKSLSIQTLEPAETAALLSITDQGLLEEMYQIAGQIKKKVYDNRIVTFAPLYTGNICVNNCAYCAFRCDNDAVQRGTLTPAEIVRETEVLVGKIGHKRLILVYPEHPQTDIEYMADSIRKVYSVTIRRGERKLNIRRVNVNAAPLAIEDLRKLKAVGIGTYQVFQETYHRATYAKLHPAGTLKSNYEWRLYCMHRALEAGIDDVGIGALFGLYNWKFEVLALLYHSLHLENRFGVGPHTISFPRIEPAANTPFIKQATAHVTDEEFKKLVAILRLSVPHAGLILTAREDAATRKTIIPLGCTQTDASTKIGIGAYSRTESAGQEEARQQFIIGDSRSLDEVVRDLATMGYITSFCTAGYRCGRTGEHIMELLRSGKEGVFCKLNAVLTFREWLDDFASPPTKEIGEKVIARELREVSERYPEMHAQLLDYYARTSHGERDLYF